MPCFAVGVSFVLLPKHLFSSVFVDDRVAVALAFVFVACTAPGRLSLAGERLVAAAIAVLFVVRIAALQAAWDDYNRDYTAYLKALEAMPEGQVLGAAIAYEGTSWDRRRPPLYHFPNLATITRHAFYPSIFTLQSAQPLALKPPYRALADSQEKLMIFRTAGPRGPEALAAAPFEYERLNLFDYVLVIREHLIKAPRPAFMKRISGGNDFSLYKIEHR
jgi:hypothetical protein